MDVIRHRCGRCLLAHGATERRRGRAHQRRLATDGPFDRRPDQPPRVERGARSDAHHAGPGGDARLPLENRSARRVGGRSVLVHVRARTPDGAQVTASTSITPRREAPPVAPDSVWPLPDELLGGPTWARWLSAPWPCHRSTRPGRLRSTTVSRSPRSGSLLVFGSLPVTLTVDLAGDQPTPIVGTIIDPLAGAGRSPMCPPRSSCCSPPTV